jgi:hypothetical protein
MQATTHGGKAVHTSLPFLLCEHRVIDCIVVTKAVLLRLMCSSTTGEAAKSLAYRDVIIEWI